MSQVFCRKIALPFPDSLLFYGYHIDMRLLLCLKDSLGKWLHVGVGGSTVAGGCFLHAVLSLIDRFILVTFLFLALTLLSEILLMD